MNLSIFDVANYFLKIVDRDLGSTITLLKLQIILYYAQGYHLAYFDKELFKEDFQAWTKGPSNDEIYEKYKKYGYDCIQVQMKKYLKLMMKHLSFYMIFGIHLVYMMESF